MKTKVILTIDTEPSIAGAFEDPSYTPLLHEPVWGEVDGNSEALGFLIQTLQQHGLVATFFVETVHTCYFSADLMSAYVDKLAHAGQDIQLHVHPCWSAFKHGTDVTEVPSDDCSALTVPVLADLIRQGSDQIEAWTGTRPTGMRTGNFATSLSVFQAMRAAGLSNSSNICIASFRPPERDLQVAGGVHEIEGITEMPVTCFMDRGPVGRARPRPMQITALSATEHIDLLDRMQAGGVPVVVIVTHPFEFLKKRSFRYERMRPNRLVQRRFETLCAFLNAQRNRFEVVPLAGAASLSAVQPPQVAGSPWRATLRAVQNALNDRLP